MSKVKPEPDLPDLGRTGVLKYWPQRWRWKISIVLALVLMIVAGIAWYNREQIAGDLIDDTLRQNGLDATYEIESIGTRRQVITNLVIGDPMLPDFTAERVSLDISYTYGPPEIGQVEVVGARLFGTLNDAKLSFGSLDPLLFAESEEPAGLPAIDLKLVDGRAQVVSDFGVIGAKLEGKGRLDDGFQGKLAATAPGIGLEGCSAKLATLFGDLTSSDGSLRFDGPVRMREAICTGNRVAETDINADLTLARDFGSIEGDLVFSASSLAGAGLTLSGLRGNSDIAWAFGGELSVRHELEGQDLSANFARVERLTAKGTLRSWDGFERTEWTSRLTGQGLDVGRLLDGSALAQARQAAGGTLVGSLLTKLETGFVKATKGSEFAADVSVRTSGDGFRAVVPEGRIKGANGETLLALSRLNYNSSSEGRAEGLAGSVLTGGSGLPRINARISQADAGETVLKMTMAQYSDGADSVAVPRFEARRDRLGRVRLTGMVQAQGAIPGGSVRGLELPIEGNWSQSLGLALGTRCLDAKFASLEAYNFTLGDQSLRLCPTDEGTMVRYADSLKVAAKLEYARLRGKLGESAVNLTASGASLRYPGGFALEDAEASIGARDNELRIAALSIEGSFEDRLGGEFAGGMAGLDAVPLDLSDLTGSWSYEEGVLNIGEATFTLTDRVDPSSGVAARFEPLVGKRASLTLANGMISAQSSLVHPWSARKVADLEIRHELESAVGSAQIVVPGIRFDTGLQPEDLTRLTSGLIALAQGTIEGSGEIDWGPDEVTSSGLFSTESFDFAAAFGPVEGVKGTIEFTDLLGLTTAPDQVATIATVNPGIEALGGRVVYSIDQGTIITVNDGRWPFMGGELILRPVTLDYGGGQGQSYIFELVGLDAATFVSQMELTNLGATGKFDGTIPIIFDRQGNGTIQGGLLISRPPGGNVSYVGELSYEDLGTMANYAFQTLRSLDYNQMSIELNGNLAGEIVTNFNIDGVRQGEGASQNFITRQLAELPIRFKVNVRSENFYQLTQVVRGFFDPSIFDREDARQQLGIGVFQPIDEPTPPPEPSGAPTPGEAERRNEPLVQPSESDEEL